MAEIVVQAIHSSTLVRRGYPWTAAYLPVHDSDAAEDVYDDIQFYANQNRHTYPSVYYSVWRGGLQFDTSEIPVGAEITSVVLTLVPLLLYTGYDICVVNGVALSFPAQLIDYGLLLPWLTYYGSKNTSEMVEEVPVDIELSVDCINKGGFTQFGFRTLTDINASDPTTNDGAGFYGMGDAGKEPKLTITYLAIALPEVATDPATKVSTTQVRLNGILTNDGGEDCDCGFEWGETILYGNTTPTQSKASGEVFSQDIAIVPSVLYHFRAKATNSAGIGYGDDQTFIVCPICGEVFTTEEELQSHKSEQHASTVQTNPATALGIQAATLNGTLVDDGGEACEYRFRYRKVGGAYSYTAWANSKVTNDTFYEDIIGLVPNTTYQFNAQARNSAGESVWGAELEFTTLVAAPSVTTDPATGVGIASATLNGTLTDDGGEACNCGFEWGKSIPYTTTTPTESKITGQTFSQIIAPLEPATVYHFRAFATNSAGIAYGADIEIRTYPALSRAYSLSKEEM